MASDGARFPARTVPRWVTGFRQNFVDHTASMAARGRACGSSGFVKISSKFRQPGFVKISSTDPPGFVKISSKLSTNLGRRSPVAEKNFFFGGHAGRRVSSKFRQNFVNRVSSKFRQYKFGRILILPANSTEVRKFRTPIPVESYSLISLMRFR